MISFKRAVCLADCERAAEIVCSLKVWDEDGQKRVQQLQEKTPTSYKGDIRLIGWAGGDLATYTELL